MKYKEQFIEKENLDVFFELLSEKEFRNDYIEWIKKEVKKIFKEAKLITQKGEFGPEYYEVIIIEKGVKGGALLSSGNTPYEAWENALPRAKKIKERLSKM